MKLFNKSNYADTVLTRIQSITGTKLPGIIANPKNLTRDALDKEYAIARVELNMEIIQFCTGGQLVDTKQGRQMKFKYPIPTSAQVAKLTDTMEKFINEVENPFFCASVAAAAGNHEAPAEEQPVDDIQNIPAAPGVNDNVIIRRDPLPVLDKVNRKMMQNYIFGTNKDGAAHLMMGVAAINRLVDYGHTLRRQHNRNIMLIAGGIVLVITGAVAAVLVVRKIRSDKAGNIDVPEIDCSADGVDVPSVDMEDISSVDVPEVSAMMI